MAEEKTEKEKEYELVNVPTGQALAISTPDEKVLSTEEALVEILNKLNKIEKAVA